MGQGQQQGQQQGRRHLGGLQPLVQGFKIRDQPIGDRQQPLDTAPGEEPVFDAVIADKAGVGLAPGQMGLQG